MPPLARSFTSGVDAGRLIYGQSSSQLVSLTRGMLRASVPSAGKGKVWGPAQHDSRESRSEVSVCPWFLLQE